MAKPGRGWSLRILICWLPREQFKLQPLQPLHPSNPSTPIPPTLDRIHNPLWVGLGRILGWSGSDFGGHVNQPRLSPTHSNPESDLCSSALNETGIKSIVLCHTINTYGNFHRQGKPNTYPSSITPPPLLSFVISNTPHFLSVVSLPSFLLAATPSTWLSSPQHFPYLLTRLGNEASQEH